MLQLDHLNRFFLQTHPTLGTLIFGYGARDAFMAMVSKSRFGGHAKTLLSAPADYRENDNPNDRPVFLVAHSLGGLMRKRSLGFQGGYRGTVTKRPERTSSVARRILTLGHCGKG